LKRRGEYNTTPIKGFKTGAFDVKSPKGFNAQGAFKGKQQLKPLGNEMRDEIIKNYGLNG
jgi:hypothetical protein